MPKIHELNHFKPTSVTVGRYSNVLIMQGVTASGWYSVGKNQMFMVTFPSDLAVTIGTDRWDGNIEFRVGSESGGGYTITIADREPLGTGNYIINFRGGRTYKFIGNGHNSETGKRDVIYTDRGFINDVDSAELRIVKNIKTNAYTLQGSPIPRTVEIMKKDSGETIEGDTRKVYYADNGWYKTRPSNSNEQQFTLQSYFANQPVGAMVARKNGNGNLYIQTVFGHPGTAVHFIRDTGYNNFGGAIQMLAGTLFHETATITVEAKNDNHYDRPTDSQGGGKLSAVYKVKVTKTSSDNYLRVSLDYYEPGGTVPNALTLRETVKTGEHTKLFQFSNPSGAWIQVWFLNIDNIHFDIRMGAGSGIETNIVAMVTEVETDEHIISRPEGWTLAKRWLCTSTDVGGTRRRWWSDHSESYSSSYYTASCKLYE